MTKQHEIIDILLKTGVFLYSQQQLKTLRSGIKSPVYINHNQLFAFPNQWKIIVKELSLLVSKDAQVLVGREEDSFAHVALLGQEMDRPIAVIRSNPQHYGVMGTIDGAEVKGKQVTLIDDHVSTGQSCLETVQQLTQLGAEISEVISITSFDFVEQEVAFMKQDVQLKTLITFPQLMKAALKQHLISTEDLASIEAWYRQNK